MSVEHANVNGTCEWWGTVFCCPMPSHFSRITTHGLILQNCHKWLFLSQPWFGGLELLLFVSCMHNLHCVIIDHVIKRLHCTNEIKLVSYTLSFKGWIMAGLRLIFMSDINFEPVWARPIGESKITMPVPYMPQYWVKIGYCWQQW